MNLIQFLKETDLITNQLSKKDLEEFVHNIARILPEKDRDVFMSQLKSYKNEGNLKTKNRKDTDLQAASQVRKAAEGVINELYDVDSGKICLESEINEEYDEWYGDSDDEFNFSDPKHVLDILNRGAKLVHQCIDAEEYKTGYNLAEMLLSLTVTVNGDYEDFVDDGMNLAELGAAGLLKFEIRKLLIDGLFGVQKAVAVEEQPDCFFRLISNSQCRDFTLEEFYQSGDREADGQKEFLKQWIAYLGVMSDMQAKRLLMEAVTLADDPDQALAAARQYAQKHPELYEILFQKNLIEGGDEMRLRIGEEALQRLEKGKVRGSVSLLLAETALRQNNVEEAERCWLETFLSDPTPVNYLRLVVESREFSRYREGTFAAVGNEAELRFLTGEFQTVETLNMNVKTALGWSSTFMKTGIALFLLYLYGDADVENLPLGCWKMLEKSMSGLRFSSGEYEKGLGLNNKLENKALFWTCFCKWRQQTPMPEEFQDKILKQIETWLRMRVNGIMEANRRNYYDECAAFIAALGETLEARGKAGAKQQMMKEILSVWPRRYAFREELCRFGYRHVK